MVFECVLPCEADHRRRIEARDADVSGLTVPTWQDVVDREYVAWDENRDGPRTVIDMTRSEQGFRRALEVLQRLREDHSHVFS